MGKHFGGDSECHILFSKKLFLYVKRPNVSRMIKYIEPMDPGNPSIPYSPEAIAISFGVDGGDQ